MTDTLKSKAINGARWGFVENISSMSVTFIVGIVLARLLSPAEFGLIGYLAIFIAVSISLIDNGFSAAIIRKPEPSREDFSTTFITNFAISLVCFAVLYLCAPLVASYFSEPQLTMLLRVLSFVLIVNAVSIIQRVIIVKALDFKRLTKCSLTSSIASGFVGIGMAAAGCGVWSLVGQQLSKQIVNSAMLWILGNWKPEWKFSKSSFRSLFSFGSNVMLTGILDTIFKNIYYPVVGKTFSSGVLGQYTRADQFSSVTSTNFTMVVQRVSFPVLSKAQDSDERLRNAYRTIVKVTMLISFFVAFWLSAVSLPLIKGLIGEKWIPAAYFLQVICLAGAFYPLHALNQNILQIKQKMHLYLALEITKKIILAVTIVAGILCCNLYHDGGAAGMKVLLWGMVVAAVLVFFINAYFSGKYINYPVIRQAMDILPSFFVSFADALLTGFLSALFIYISKNIFGWYNATWTNLCGVAFGSAIGIMILVLYFHFFPRKEFAEVKNLISIWKSQRNSNKQ